MTTKRWVRATATVAITALSVAYVLWKIDIHRTIHILSRTDPWYFLGAVGIIIGAIAPMAWRWQRLLAVQGVKESLEWLTRTYYVSYAVSQVLPTALGGDAARIYSTSRRHRGHGEAVAGSVLLERALGGVATLALAAIGFVLAVGRYDVGPYLWIEAGIAFATVAAAFTIFSRGARRLLSFTVPTLRTLRIERPLRIAYEGMHRYRRHPRLLTWAFGLTLVVQTFRVAAIWMIGKSVGVELSPRPYYVLGPMLFLVMLVPFTINGIALREAFFVNFLGTLSVSADRAFATGFLFFLTGVLSGVPGALILGFDALRAARSRRSALASKTEA